MPQKSTARKFVAQPSEAAEMIGGMRLVRWCGSQVTMRLDDWFRIMFRTAEIKKKLDKKRLETEIKKEEELIVLRRIDCRSG